MELSQLETACMHYKERLGDYPPDFAGITNATWTATAQATILRHLARAFSRYTPGAPSGVPQAQLGTWNGFRADVLGNLTTDPWYNSSLPTYEGWGINVNMLSPSTALAFFLGGKPEWIVNSAGNPILPSQTGFDPNKPVTALLGFSANPLNPFDNSSSRIALFYDFDIASLGWVDVTGASLPAGFSEIAGLAYWPKVQGVTDKTGSAPIVYFRAENTSYTIDGNFPNSVPTVVNQTNNIKSESVLLSPAPTGPAFPEVWPAVDTNLSNIATIHYDSNKYAPVYKWVNPTKFQIFASGLDLKYAPPSIVISGVATPVDCVAYPTGETLGIDATTAPVRTTTSRTSAAGRWKKPRSSSRFRCVREAHRIWRRPAG